MPQVQDVHKKLPPQINEEDGEVLCDKCQGEGNILNHDIQLMDYICPKCNGEGKVDWVRNVMWKDHEWNWEELDAYGYFNYM